MKIQIRSGQPSVGRHCVAKSGRQTAAVPGQSRRAFLGTAVKVSLMAGFGHPFQNDSLTLAAGDVPDHQVSVNAQDIVLGNPDSRNVVVEYFSFSCPHCERFHREVFPLIRTKYLDTDRLLFVLRDFPLNITALKAAQIAHCGGRDRYVEIHDALWAAWESWINLESPDQALIRIAAEHGIRRESAAACLVDKDLEGQILGSYLKGARDYDVESTPTFIINGRRYRGFLSFERFERAVSETAKGDN